MVKAKQSIGRRLIKSSAVRLSMHDKIVLGIRTALQSFSVGAMIDQAVFGTADTKRLARVERFMHELVEELRQHEKQLSKVQRDLYDTDAFAYLAEGILRRAVTEVQEAKLAALRGALVSIVLDPEKWGLEKQTSFLQTIDLMQGVHIRVLALLGARYKPDHGPETFVSYDGIGKILDVHAESDWNFLYSSLDTLANREFVQCGPVPFKADGTLDKRVQRFRATELGLEFLKFIRASERTPLRDNPKK